LRCGTLGYRIKLFDQTIVTAKFKFQPRVDYNWRVGSIELGRQYSPIEHCMVLLGRTARTWGGPFCRTYRGDDRHLAANMGQTSGSSIMLSTSAGQQIAEFKPRISPRCFLGISQKKLELQNVKAGLQVLLVSK
jgi:hypothetical protein